MIRDCPKSVAIWNAFINPRERASFYSLPIKDWITWNLERKVCFASIPWSDVFSVACHDIWAQRNHLNKSSEDTWLKVPHRRILRWNLVGGNRSHHVLKQTQMELCAGGLIKQDVELRDHKGTWLSGFMANIGSSSILGAKLWGILYSHKEAWGRGYRKVELECDSSLAIKGILELACSTNFCHPTLYSTKDMLTKEWEVRIKPIPRTMNKCADSLAKKSLSYPLGLLSLDSMLEWIRNEVEKDMGLVSHVIRGGGGG
ncbi:putative reverse transcriptase [Senna tora]|uniref:Putative reverse transcriptase n=1 Tax=Senna tora TaxID=362788 RepID=A0A834TF02_9FABA|nr:putative reverse transcriptase [Senna tora]